MFVWTTSLMQTCIDHNGGEIMKMEGGGGGGGGLEGREEGVVGEM